MVSGKLNAYESNLQNAEMMIQALKERLRLERIAKYGPGSEKLTNQQLELLELEPGVGNLEVAAEGEREALPPTPDKKKRKHPGRQTLPADLPRVERVIACTSEQCVCGGCGQSTMVIGYEESEQLDVEPMKYFVLVTKREKQVTATLSENRFCRGQLGQLHSRGRVRGQQLPLDGQLERVRQCWKVELTTSEV